MFGSVSLSRALLLVAFMLPGTAFAQDHCSGWLIGLSYKWHEFKGTQADGTEWRRTETHIALCADQEIKAEVIAAIRQGREVSESTLAELRKAIKAGTAAVRVITTNATDLGRGHFGSE